MLCRASVSLRLNAVGVRRTYSRFFEMRHHGVLNFAVPAAEAFFSEEEKQTTVVRPV